MTKPYFPTPQPASSGAGTLAAALWLAAALGAACPVGAQTLQLPDARSPGLSGLPATSPAGDALRTADFIVAVVNSEPITNNEVLARLARIEQQLTRQGQLPPRSELAAEVLERLILERAQLQLAQTLGVKPDEAAIDQAVAAVARQNQISMNELKRRLASEGLDYARFRADLRDELTLVRLREREVESRIKVSEQDIDQFLRERPPETGPEQLNLAQIFVAVPENAPPEQVVALQARAQKALERVRAGEPFASVAAELSDAPDRAQGGVLGLRPPERLPTLFVEASRGVAVGALLGPLRSGAGFHVLQLIEKKNAASAGSVVQSHARHILLRPNAQLNESAAVGLLHDLKRRIAAGQADFATLAREKSQDGSAAEGGDLGWTGPGTFVPEFEQVLNQLAPGQIAEPLVSRFGVHLIELLARREAQLSEREQREQVRGLLREKKTEEALALWQQEVRGRAYVELRN